MIKSRMSKIISTLEKEVKSLDNEIEIFKSNVSLEEGCFERDQDYFNYSNLMGKRFFLQDCIYNIECCFNPGGDLYEQDKLEYEEGFDSYLAGQLESFDLYLSIIKSIG